MLQRRFHSQSFSKYIRNGNADTSPDDPKPADSMTHGFGEMEISLDPNDDEPLPIWVMKMTQSAYRDMMEHLESRRPEAAGILIGPVADDMVVTHFVADTHGRSSPASFQLHTPSLNRELRKAKLARMNCKGIVHSHPSGIPQPSHGDLNYLESLFQLPANAAAMQFFMPIVCDGRLHPYVYSQGGVWPTSLLLV